MIDRDNGRCENFLKDNNKSKAEKLFPGDPERQKLAARYYDNKAGYHGFGTEPLTEKEISQTLP